MRARIEMSARIETALQAIRAAFPLHDFNQGDCHHLAAALYQAFNCQGRLHACLRYAVDADQDPCLDFTQHYYNKTYSHMVYEDANGTIWDINGDAADTRWEDGFDSASPDDDLVNRFDWVTVPHVNLQLWLQEHGARFDLSMVSRLAALARNAPPAPPQKPRMG